MLGENGSGKSVLLRCLSGILKQDGGEVIMMTDDVPVASGSSGSSGVVDNFGGSGVVDAEIQIVTRRRPKIGFAPQVCIFEHLPLAVVTLPLSNLFLNSSKIIIIISV